MKPFKLRIDWLCHEAYGDAVVVELHVMGEEPRVIHRATSAPDSAGWARKWFADRGIAFWCHVDWHQRHRHTHVTLHATGRLFEEKPLRDPFT